MSLRDRAAKGVFWTFTEQFGIQAIIFLVSIIIARILTPEEFGLIGMLTIFIAIARSLIDSGMAQSLLRSETLTQADYSTVFFFNLFGSIVLYCILYVAAPYIASFYKQDILCDIIRVYCLSFIINSFSAVQLTRLSKLMDFKTQTLVSVPSQIGGGIVGIVLAQLGYGVWSLVYMNLAQSLLNVIQIVLRSKWLPSFVFDRQKFLFHFSFGYKLGLAGLINTVFNNIYAVVIGKYFSAVDVGYFTRAVSIKSLPVSNLSVALNKVTFPLFASIQGDDIKLKNVYQQIMKAVIFVIAPVLFFLSALAEPLVSLLLTDKWLPMVPYLQVLCFGGILSPIHSYNLNILKVKGRSDLFLRLEIVKRAILILTIIFTLNFGVMGIIWGQLIDSIIFLFVNSYYSGKFINYSLLQQIKDLAPYILLAFLCGLAVYKFINFLQINEVRHITCLMSGTVLGTAVYLGAAWLFKMEAFTFLIKMIKSK